MSGLDGAQTVGAGGFRLRRRAPAQRTGGADAGEQVVARFEEHLGIRESLEQDLATNILGAIGEPNVDAPGGINVVGGNRGRRVGSGRSAATVHLHIAPGGEGAVAKALEAKAVVGDKVAVLELKIAGARGVIQTALAVFNDEKALPPDGKVGLDSGSGQRALGKIVLDGGGADAGADLHAGGAGAAAGGGAGGLQGLAEGVGEFGPGAFVSDRIGVRDVVANDVKLTLKGLEAADAGVERAKHND